MKQKPPTPRAAPDAAPADASRMTPEERGAAASLAAIYTLRMLGLFMIFPVLSLHANEYPDASPLFVGLAISAYGATQAVFQIPFGMLSDRIGRKPVITAGLLVFAAGSVVAALAHTMAGVVLGRALQGLGAIAGAIMALTADLTREEHRTKAMGMIGVSIGMAFVLAQVIGPAVTRSFGLPGLFWLTGALGLAAIAILHLRVPDPVETRLHRDTEPVLAQFGRVMRDPELLRLDGGILVAHLVMTANTVVVPLVLRDHAGVPEDRFWLVYLGVLALSVVFMVPIIVRAERRARLKHALLSMVVVLVASQVGFAAMHDTLGSVLTMLVVYFTAFNVLEAVLPSLVSRLSPPDLKGTSLAAFSTSHYIGAFIGGPLGGWLYETHGLTALFLVCGGLAVLWLLVGVGMRNPDLAVSRVMRVGPLEPEHAPALESRLRAVRGVREAVVIAEEGLAYLKIDRADLDDAALRAFSVAGP